MGTFYLGRWQVWLDALQSALAAGRAADVKAIRARIRANDVDWTGRHDTFPTVPQGETIEASRRLFQKYSGDASDSTLGLVAE